MKQIIFFYLLNFTILFQAQTTIKGTVTDAKTGEVLAFANIILDKNTGTITDFDGKFELTVPDKYKKFTISYIGYKTKNVALQTGKKIYNIRLQPSNETLNTVVINGKYTNPAIALMKNAIRLKSNNDYRKDLDKYSFTKYYKFLVSAYIDKITDPFDTIYKNNKVFTIDSSLYKLKKDLSDKHAYLMESVTKVNAKNKQEKAKVVATRTAGLKNPLYELLALQMSGYNVYDDRYKFLFQQYLGPFSKASLKQYRYEIDDTITLQNRKVIAVNYKNTKKPLISGKIYLDAQSKAIAKMTLNTYKEFQFNADRNFTYFPKYDIWFPKDDRILIKKAEKDNFNFGNAIQITSQSKNDTLRHSNPKKPIDYTYAEVVTKYSDIILQENYPDKITYNMEVSPVAAKSQEKLWKKYRGIEHTPRELRTYQYIDSISKVEKVEEKLQKFKSVFSGYYPVGRYFEWDILKLMDYNRYEGFRLQLGGRTGQNFSNKIQVSGYVAYGFKDKDFKYSGTLSYKLHHATQSFLYASHYKDVSKAAGFTDFFQRSIYNYNHHFNHDKFTLQKGYTLGFNTLITPKLWLDLEFSQIDSEVKFNIPYHPGRIEFQQKDLSFINIKVAYTPFARYYLSDTGRKLLKDAYPKFYLSFEKNLPALQVDPTQYFRLDLQAVFKKTYLNNNYTDLVIKSGYAPKDAPIEKLYQPNTNDYGYENVLKRFNLQKNNSFETMRDLEFVDNNVITLHLSHTFTKIKLSKKYNFDLRLITRLARGFSYNNNQYYGIQSLDKIYYESGLEFRRLFQSLGLGFYYRMGAYSFDKPIENLSFKITIDPFKFKLN